LFAILAATLIGQGFFPREPRPQKWWLSIYFFLVITSHNLFDALTRGFGVAFFYPFDKTQYNLPITPLNPAGWNFAEFRANDAIGRECLYVWLPMLLISAATYFWRRRRTV